MLHIEELPSKPNDSEALKESEITSLHTRIHETPSFHALLATTYIYVKEANNNWLRCRALLDSGSEANFVSENFAKTLGIKRSKANISVNGIGNKTILAKGYVQIEVSSRNPQHDNFELKAIILPQLPKHIPSIPLDGRCENFSNITLADPQYYKKGPVDVIIGAARANHVTLPGRIIHDQISANETIFGWTITGEIKNEVPDIGSYHSQVQQRITLQSSEELHSSLKTFWELEAVESHTRKIGEKFEEFYVNTTKRHDDGRYEVKLPMKSNHPPFGNSFSNARSQLLSLEKKFNKNIQLREQYTNVIQEYINMKHLEPVPEVELKLNANECFYLPHHAVFKEESVST